MPDELRKGPLDEKRHRISKTFEEPQSPSLSEPGYSFRITRVIQSILNVSYSIIYVRVKFQKNLFNCFKVTCLQRADRQTKYVWLIYRK